MGCEVSKSLIPPKFILVKATYICWWLVQGLERWNKIDKTVGGVDKEIFGKAWFKAFFSLSKNKE